MKNTPYIQHAGKVVETDGKFTHVMAVFFDSTTNYKEGIVRCIMSREGDVKIRGYVDRSQLYLLERDPSGENYKITNRLSIRKEREIIDKLIPAGWDFIGLEDPDIWVDEIHKLIHVYFTIPIKPPIGKDKIHIHLGHAVGKDLRSLEMTEPVLLSGPIYSAKELSIAPLNKHGFHFNLIESCDRLSETTYSVVQVARVHDMGKSWEYGDIVFHPKEHNIPWIGGHASPGPLLPKSFIDVGEGKLLGIMNGREANQKVGDQVKYGMFSVGLFIYDYENGKIDWVSPEALIQDTEAVTITFASQFVETKPGEGVLYAHVDDSFVRAYTLFAESIKKLLPVLQ